VHGVLVETSDCEGILERKDGKVDRCAMAMRVKNALPHCKLKDGLRGSPNQSFHTLTSLMPREEGLKSNPIAADFIFCSTVWPTSLSFFITLLLEVTVRIYVPNLPYVLPEVNVD